MNSLRFMGLKANPILYYPGVLSTSVAERIRIKAGQEIHIDFPLRIPKLFAVSGRVVNPSWDARKTRARIRMRPQEHDLGLLATSTNQTESDAQGNFVFTQIVQGLYAISAVDEFNRANEWEKTGTGPRKGLRWQETTFPACSCN